MDTLLQSQVFFFISSVGFLVLWFLTAVLLIYLIRAAGAFSRIMEKFEKDINNIGDTTKELLSEMRENIFFKFLFGKKKKSRKS
ncbi:MAG: hypothetical protein P4L63_02045 [Candidatus Pacebacteria bacterium]|jgi:hypothetical protein|nr:hypothetical protein [Candidatus Paceibacterota bacterium]